MGESAGAVFKNADEPHGKQAADSLRDRVYKTSEMSSKECWWEGVLIVFSAYVIAQAPFGGVGNFGNYG